MTQTEKPAARVAKWQIIKVLQAPSFARLMNVALRGMTLASKFLLVLFLAKFLEPSELGLYGLLVVSITYALYLVGLDFYTFTTREIIKRERGEWGDILKNQIALSVVLYSIFVPVLCVLFVKDFLPVKFIGWFFCLLLLEHVAQELNRVLVALSAQLVASFVLFLRSGVWAVIAVGVMFLDDRRQTLEFVLLCWTVGGICACLFSVLYLHRMKPVGWHKSIDWGWIKAGVSIAVPFLISTLAMRGIVTLDKYWVEHLSGLEFLGAYVLFMSISNALVSFLDAGVFVFMYPGLIKAHNSGAAEEFRRVMLRLTIQCVLIGMIFSVLAILSMPLMLKLLDQPLYVQQAWMFPWVMLATFIFCLGMIPQFGLYAQGKDKHIIVSHIASFVVFVLVAYSLSAIMANFAIVVALLAGFSVSFVWKAVAYIRLSPVEYIFVSNRK